MTIHFTYYQKGEAARSGHVLKDIMSVFIFAFLFQDLDVKVVYNSTYERQSIIDPNSLKSYCTPRLAQYNKHYTISEFKCWKGIAFKQFRTIRSRILKLSRKHPKLLVTFTSVCRIHPHQLRNWFLNHKIPYNYYATHFIPFLHDLYPPQSQPHPQPQIAIHIRRGDVARQQIKMGFNVEYYANLIKALKNRFPQFSVHIYSENRNNNDLLEFQQQNQIPDLHFHFGGSETLKDHFHQLCISQILILSSSSFSTWAAYLSKGIVLYEYSKIKQFSHPLKNLPKTPKFIAYKDKLTPKQLARIEKHIILSNPNHTPDNPI